MDRRGSNHCILISSKNQQKIEREYYSDIFGFRGDFLFTESVDEAQLMVVQNNGFMPFDENALILVGTTAKIPLIRRGKPITRHYRAFWKTDNLGYYVEEFADILKSIFKQKD